MTLHHQNIVFGVCYRSPSSSITFINELHDAINAISTRYPSSCLFLLGDFNFPNICWNTQPPHLSPFSTEASNFLDLCSVFSLSQLITQPTRTLNNTASTLDLILTNRPDFASSVTYSPGLSDHLLLTFHINASPPRKAKEKKYIRDYKNANFEAINNELSAFTDSFLLHFDDRSVQCNWDLFSSKIHQLMDKYIPNRVVTSYPHAPWYNSHIKRLSNRKKRFYRLAKKSPTRSRWDTYRVASEAYVHAIKNAKKSFLSTVLPSMLKTNIKKFWRVINPPAHEDIGLEDDFNNPVPFNMCASILNDTFVKKLFQHQASGRATFRIYPCLK